MTLAPIEDERERLRMLERRRVDVLFNLSWSWTGDDLNEPLFYHQAIARAPSLMKEAVSQHLVEGVLDFEGGGLVGRLTLTALGRLAVRRLRHRLKLTSWEAA